MGAPVLLGGKVAIVTGASSGIGRECSIELAREGAAVVLAARDRHALTAAVAQIQADGGAAAAVPCDVTDRAQVDALVGRAVELYGGVQILVNAAQSFVPDGRLEACTLEQFNIPLQSGLMGTLNVMQSAFSYLRDAGGASVINFGDPDAVVGEPGRMPNNVAKAAVGALSRTAAREWGRYGIRVNLVEPTVLTPRLQEEIERTPGLQPWLEGQIPGAKIGEPRYVARTVVFLASSDSDVLTGMAVQVDGGRGMFA